MLADYHVHTEFSDDSREPMEEQVKKAISLGLTELCFTDHVDYGIKKDWAEGNIEYLVYLKNTDRDSVTDETENDDQIMTDAFVSEISDIVEEAHKETK